MEAHEAVLYGHWDEAARILDERIAEAQSGITHYSDPCCYALRASIALARGDLQAATRDSEWALEGARRIKEPQLLAPALTMRAMVQLSQERPSAASRDASEMLLQGSILIPALLELHPTVTAVELAWLTRDLGREADLISAIESAPSTPWHEAARAIAGGDLGHSIELPHRRTVGGGIRPATRGRRTEPSGAAHGGTRPPRAGARLLQTRRRDPLRGASEQVAPRRGLSPTRKGPAAFLPHDKQAPF